MNRNPREGYVIVAVLIVVVVLSLAAYTFTDAMSAEHRASVRTRDASQARLAAVSGIHYVAAALADPATAPYLGNPTAAGAFHADGEGMTIAADPHGAGRDPRFALMAVVPDGNGGVVQQFGSVVDEGGKLNINALIQYDATGKLLYDSLMKLPNMTAEVADSIVDWVDADDTARTEGAESSYYGSLGQGYAAKNGPLNSLDELLLVRGINSAPDLLFGTDRNRNGLADDFEGQEFSRGWSDYLTIYGRELNVDSFGVVREYLNNTELDQLAGLHERLVAAIGQEPADFIMAYRLFQSSTIAPQVVSVVINGNTGSTTVTSSGGSKQQQNTRLATSGELSAAVKTALSAEIVLMRGKRINTSLMDLRNVQITLPKPEGAQPNDPTPVYPSPLGNPATMNAWLPLLLEKTTLTTRVELTPRLNVNTAPREVLLAIPTLTETDVNNIVSMRANQPVGEPGTITGAWLVTSAAIAPDTFKAIEKYVTGQSMIYRVQSIGYTNAKGPVARVEAVIDTNRGAPRILYFRDLSELGGATVPGSA